MPFLGKLPGCGAITLNRSELMFYWCFFCSVLFTLSSYNTSSVSLSLE